MNNIINFYYNLYIVDLFNYQDNYFFNYNNQTYYFVKYDRDIKDLKSILDICTELKKRNIKTNEFVRNKFNDFITFYNGNYYVLIVENINEYKISYNDILYIQNSTINISYDKNLLRNNHANMWKNKIDFYEKQSAEICNKYHLINNTLDYYIGLGENAIEYLVNNEVRINQVVLSHRRINENYESIDFYNPLNYIIDNRARDVADYIKALFFFKDVNDEAIISFLRYVNFNRDEYILFFARMVFPTYYFDLIDKIIFVNEDEEILKNIINKNDDYLRLLKRIYYFINYDLRINIPMIEWIIKKI